MDIHSLYEIFDSDFSNEYNEEKMGLLSDVYIVTQKVNYNITLEENENHDLYYQIDIEDIVDNNKFTFEDLIRMKNNDWILDKKKEKLIKFIK